MISRLHIVDEFNRDMYDYIIASDEKVLDSVTGHHSGILLFLKTATSALSLNFECHCVYSTVFLFL